MALCRIGGSPGSHYGWSEFATTNAAVGDMLAIIGHPLGQPKRIEAGPATSLSGSVIRYNDIDTLGGNSGSGILQQPVGTGRRRAHQRRLQLRGHRHATTGVAIAAIVAASPTLQSDHAELADRPRRRTVRHRLSSRLQAAPQHAADTGILDKIGTILAGTSATPCSRATSSAPGWHSM